jgi:hypothetical protein
MRISFIYFTLDALVPNLFIFNLYQFGYGFPCPLVDNESYLNLEKGINVFPPKFPSSLNTLAATSQYSPYCVGCLFYHVFHASGTVPYAFYLLIARVLGASFGLPNFFINTGQSSHVAVPSICSFCPVKHRNSAGSQALGPFVHYAHSTTGQRAALAGKAALLQTVNSQLRTPTDRMLPYDFTAIYLPVKPSL